MSYLEDIIGNLEKRRDVQQTEDTESQNVMRLLTHLSQLGVFDKETDPFFLASPAALLSKRDLGFLRSLPERMEKLRKMPGPIGKTGPQGPKPELGKDYTIPVPKDGKDGKTIRGKQGPRGPMGPKPRAGIDYRLPKDGYTPQKGVDYFDGEDADPKEVLKYAGVPVAQHEKEFKHELLHDSHTIGTKQIDESGLADRTIPMYDKKRDLLFYVPLPEPVINVPPMVLPQDLGLSATPEFIGLILKGLTASRVIVTNGDKELESSSVTTTELSYLEGATSNIQDQINSIGSPSIDIRTVTSNDSVNASDDLILGDCALGAITVTLPAIASSFKRVLIFKKIDSSDNFFIFSGDANVDNDAQGTIPGQHGTIKIIGGSTQWYVIP